MGQPTKDESKKMCKRFGLYFEGIQTHGDSLILLNKFCLAMSLVERAAEVFSDNPPDYEWFRDYYLISGEHMILTDEGWEPGNLKEQIRKDCDDPEWEPNDEVNIPAMATSVRGHGPDHD
jgi:hypothetical protein